MKNLIPKSTIVFDTLLNILGDNKYLKIVNTPYLPLVLEKVGEDIITTPLGPGYMYSLCHYGVMNGDLMQNPEILFIVVDLREDNEADVNNLFVFPIMYQNAYLEKYEESVRTQKMKVTECDTHLQNLHTQFAIRWLDNIEKQQFLNAKKIIR